MQPDTSTPPALRRTLAFGAIAGLAAAAIWFLSRPASPSIDIRTLEGGLTLVFLLLTPAGTAAVFAGAFGVLGARFGVRIVSSGVFLLGVLSVLYPAMRTGRPPLATAVADGLLVGLVMAAFAGVSALLASARSDSEAR